VLVVMMFFIFFCNDCKLGITKLYADSFKYPPPVAGLKQLPSTDPTWKNLAHDIQYALHESGSPLILNGSNGVCCLYGLFILLPNVQSTQEW
jgi:hypothetical protein